MTRTRRLLALALLPLLALGGAAAHAAGKLSARAVPPSPPGAGKGQGTGERSAQADLPQSKAPVWGVLRRTRIGEDPVRGVFTAAFPPEVKAMNRTTVALTGFMLPLDAEARSKHFLLSKYTPVCFFCPPGEPNEVVEVLSRTGLPITDRMIQVTGRFALTNDAEKGLFFRIDDAQVK